MRKSMLKSFIALAALLRSIVSASLVVPRAGNYLLNLQKPSSNISLATETLLDSRSSINGSGSPVATIIPTTGNGAATPLSPDPGVSTFTTGDTMPAPAPISSDAVATPTGSFPVCHNVEGEFAPFCLPANGSIVYVGETYYGQLQHLPQIANLTRAVTWDINYLAEKNATVIVQANYVNASDGGPQAFESPITANYRGFYALTIDKAWLEGQSWNNVTLYLFPSNPAANEPQSFTGPTVMVTNRPPTWYRQPKTSTPNGETLYIALPCVFGAIIVMVCGTHLWNRKNRKIGLGNVMGRRKGYGSGKSKMQRLGLRSGRKRQVGDIRLREQELIAGGQYRDVPEDGDITTRAAGWPLAHSGALA